MADDLKTNTNTTSSADAPETPAGAAVEAPAPTPAETDELRAKAAKADEHWERYVRVAADFDNYKKRALRERQEAVKFANEALLQKLAPVLDNFELALAAAATAADAPAQSLQEGVRMILQQFKAVLNEAGLEEVDATNQDFDPNLHEALAQQPSAEVPEGRVLQQVRKGYKLKDRLLRPAQVIVAKKP